MNFKELTLKMVKANARRYILYILCSGFSVMIFFLYLTMSTNKDFNDKYKVTSVISSNVYAPTLVLGIFSAVFIIYANDYFEKFRKKDFGLFMTLGMTDNDIRKIIILENSLIAVISIVGGLFLGTLLSKIFYFVILKIINMNLNLLVNIKSYLYAIAFFSLINIIIIMKNCILVKRYKILGLLKSERIPYNNSIGKPLGAILGVIFVTISIGVELLIYKKITTVLLMATIVIFFAGIYLIIASLPWFVTKFYKLFKNKYAENLLFISNIKYTIGISKNIILSISLLITILVFFLSLSSVSTLSLKDNAITYNPYDVAYLKVYGKNNISQDAINRITKASSVKVKSVKNLELISKGIVTIISDKVMNETLGTKITVDKGKYISLFQIDDNDGYGHEIWEFKEYTIDNTKYTSQGKLQKIFFNTIPFLNDSHFLIFNYYDYEKIRTNSKADSIGNIVLMNLNSWTQSEAMVNKMNDEMMTYNGTYTKSFYETVKADQMQFRVVSKITDFKLAEQAGNFLTFLFGFIFTLFFISSNLMIHFKLLTELEKEKIKYEKLFKIGIKQKEIEKNILKELRLMFFSPCVLGVAMGAYFVYYGFVKVSFYGNCMKYSSFSGLAYVILEVLFYLMYKRYYLKKVLYL